MLGKALLVAFYGTSTKDQDEKLRRCTNFFIKAMQHINHVASWHWESLQKNLQKHFNKTQKQNEKHFKHQSRGCTNCSNKMMQHWYHMLPVGTCQCNK